MLRVATRSRAVALIPRTGVRNFGSETCRDLSWNTTGPLDNGFPWPPDSTTDSLKEARAFEAGPNDVYVATYPKSGTTWMLHIIYQLVTQGNLDYKAFHKEVPFWESVPGLHVGLNQAKAPKVIKTHAPLSLLPDFSAGRGKFVYVCRDPRDVVVSFYNHSMLSNGDKQMGTLPFDKFFQNFMDGKVFYGSWFDHVEDAVRQSLIRDGDGLMFVTYEDMKADLDAVLTKLIAFLELDIDPKVLKDTIRPRLEFQWMKANEDKLDFTQEYPDRDQSKSFFRSGKTGSYKDLCSQEQLDILKRRFDASLCHRLISLD